MPDEKARTNPFVRIDAKVDAPIVDPDAEGNAFRFLVPPAPELVAFNGEGFEAMVPKSWPRDGDAWKDPKSIESVTIKVMRGSAQETPENVISVVVGSLGKNLVPEAQRRLPPEFVKMIGADAASCAMTRDQRGGKNGLPLQSYFLMASKGEKRILVIVTRTQHPTRIDRPGGGFAASRPAGSPDGEALARGVMRSLRIRP